MERVLLFSLRNDTIKVTIEAYFDKDGNLVIDGYDIGKTVNAFWGDSDYEYSSTIIPDDVKKLYPLFSVPDGDRAALLEAIQKQFNSNSCYSEIQEFLDQHNVAYTGFSWR